MTTTVESPACTLTHPRFPDFLASLVDERYTATDLVSVVRQPEQWGEAFAAFLVGANVRSPKAGEALTDWLARVVFAGERRESCQEREWSELEFIPENGKPGDNLVADLSDYFHEPVEHGAKHKFCVYGHWLEATFHLETQYGRQVVVAELEAIR